MTEQGEWLDLEDLVPIAMVADLMGLDVSDAIDVLCTMPDMELLALSTIGKKFGFRKDTEHGQCRGHFWAAALGEDALEDIFVRKISLSAFQKINPAAFGWVPFDDPRNKRLIVRSPAPSESTSVEKLGSASRNNDSRTGEPSPAHQEEIEQLKAEVARLTAELAQKDQGTNKRADGAAQARKYKDLTTAETWAEYLKSAVYLACLWGKDGEQLSKGERKAILKKKKGYFELTDDADKAYRFAMRDFQPGSIKGPANNPPRLDNQNTEVEQSEHRGSQSEYPGSQSTT